MLPRKEVTFPFLSSNPDHPPAAAALVCTSKQLLSNDCFVLVVVLKKHSFYTRAWIFLF